MSIEWQNTRDPLPEQVLRGAELLLGVTFPAEYRTCVRDNHGGHPEPNRFRVAGPTQSWGGCVGTLLSLDPYAPENVWVTIACLAVDRQLPAGLVPVADDGGGDLVCLDYRAGPEAPRVAYCFHEAAGGSGVFAVAETFAEFLALLGRRPTPEPGGPHLPPTKGDA